MRCSRAILSLSVAMFVTACGGGSGDTSSTPTETLETTEGIGTGATDSGITDSGDADTGATDSSGTSSGVTDTGNADTGNADTGTADTGTADAGGADADPLIYVTPDGVAQCSVDDIKSRVDFDMRDYYIYYDRVPTVDLADYDSGDALIRDLRVSPDIYSSVRDAATQSALLQEGRKEAFGFSLGRSDGVLRFRIVDIGSPAYTAGILRGDALLEINDLPISEVSQDQINEWFGPDSTEPVTMSIQTGDNEARTVTVGREEYRWVTAAAQNRFTPENDPNLPNIGYLSVQSFLATTQQEIDDALQLFEDQGGVDELIVDLRYNLGGRTSVALHLGSLIGGAAVEGQVFIQTRRNDKYTILERTINFEKVDNALNSPRVFVLTSGDTASASEILINSLKPFIDVVVIGGVTEGKTFGSFEVIYCDKAINAMTEVAVNANDVDVLGGIRPDCNVQDSWNSQAQSSDDPLVAAALNYAARGTCGIEQIASSNSNLTRKAPVGLSFTPKELADFALIDHR